MSQVCKVKVRKAQKKNFEITEVLQARQWVQMWHSYLGEEATPAAVIEALQECGGEKDVILSDKKFCDFV